MRPSWNEYHMGFARLAATRGTCNRAQVGCVLVKENRILATGYNGAPPGQAHCDEVGHLMMGGNCVRGTHAEVGTLLFCARHGIAVGGASAFITHFPCIRCLVALMSAGITKIRYETLYLNGISEEVFRLIKSYHDTRAINLADMAGRGFHTMVPTFETGLLTKLEEIK